MTTDQQPVELILARGLMSNLTTPAFLVDASGVLVFFNDAAGELLGIRFEEAGPMMLESLGTRFELVTPDGQAVPPEEMTLSIALREARPAHKRFRIRTATGHARMIEITAFPIIGTTGRRGAMAIFWGAEES